MAVYTFSFDSAYAGHTATVIDNDGAEVTGSPITLDAAGDGSLSGLTTGTYRAQVADAEGARGLGYTVAEGMFSVEQSIAAAGINPNGTVYTFESTTTTNVDPSLNVGAAISFDVVPDGHTPGTDIDLPSGIYMVSIEVDLAEPAEQRWVAVSVRGSGGMAVPSGPFVITPGATNSNSRLIFTTLLLNRYGAVPVALLLATAVDSAAVTPADLQVEYAYLQFQKIG